MNLQNANIAIAVVIGISLLCLVLFRLPQQTETQPPVYNYGNLTVKQLVAKLTAPDQKDNAASKEETPQPGVHSRVAAAEKELLSRGAKLVPQLVHFRDDPRVSNTGKDGSAHTVGQRVSGIILRLMKPTVKLPAVPPPLNVEGRPDFGMYYNEVGHHDYNRWAWRSTPQQQELAYLRWYISTTRSGFPDYTLDDHVDKHLAPYIARATTLEQLGVQTGGPLARPKKRTGPSAH